MITLHHLEKSRSFRVLWLLEELKATYGLEYQLISYNRNIQNLAPSELEQFHPMGKAPILVDDSLPQGEQALAESALIIEYLLKFYDSRQQFSTSNTFSSWRDYQFWLHFAEGSLMPPVVMKLILLKAVEKSPFFAKPIVRQVKAGAEKMLLDGNIQKGLQLLEKQLQGKEWLVDEKLTGADIQLYFAAAGAIKISQLALDDFPNIARWLKHCEQRPAFKRAIELGGKPL
ncbi:glutathione S-transferase [Mannheimia indoligenes]|uniref:glutathione S-transferase family protein n=1 Tax=Mannheimia indoligenes TaxID=3103145 RepID=UPI002FE56B35